MVASGVGSFLQVRGTLSKNPGIIAGGPAGIKEGSKDTGGL